LKKLKESREISVGSGREECSERSEYFWGQKFTDCARIKGALSNQCCQFRITDSPVMSHITTCTDQLYILASKLLSNIYPLAAKTLKLT
jgi:hypothetical protein